MKLNANRISTLVANWRNLAKHHAARSAEALVEAEATSPPDVSLTAKAALETGRSLMLLQCAEMLEDTLNAPATTDRWVETPAGT